MEIRKKIALQFTAIVAVLLMVSLMIIYLLFSSLRKDDFKDRLSNRAKSIGQLIAETESAETELLKRIERNNPTSLPRENITVFNSQNQIIYISGEKNSVNYNPQLFEQVKIEKTVYYKIKSREVIGFYYEGKKDKVILFCSAYDLFGFRKLKNLRLILIFVFSISLVVVYFLGRVFANKALNPITDVINQVNEIDISNINERVTVGNEKDEIAILAHTFNNMLSRLDNAFTTQKDFISNVSHELRTPLTAITGQLEVSLLKERRPEEYKLILSSVLEDIKNLNKLTNRLLTLLKAENTLSDKGFKIIRIDDILWKSRADVLKRNKKNAVNISFGDSIEGEHHFQLLGNPELLKIAIVNLIDNGCKYSSNRKVNVQLSIKDDKMEIKFIDEGIGIPKDDIEKIFQPFYRGTNVKKNKGHGIGMSLVDKIVKLHKGNLDISSVLKKGTCIIIRLPFKQ